jgi:hypothetical protein
VGGTLVAGPQGDSWRVLAELPRAEPALGVSWWPTTRPRSAPGW